MKNKRYYLKPVLFLLIFSFSCVLYAKSYETDFDVQDFINTTTDVNITLDGKNYVFEPVETDILAGFVFYPGGYVNYEAYIPLLKEIARKGIFCVMPKMRHDLAIYNIDAAGKIIKNFENIEKWYVGGHSLGGAMAAVYASNNAQKLKGLILMAAYSTVNLNDKGLNVISVYGSNDGVLNFKKYKKYQKNLPPEYKELIIEGGNHSGFGCYGFQKGDNPSTISEKTQKEITAEYILNNL